MSPLKSWKHGEDQSLCPHMFRRPWSNAGSYNWTRILIETFSPVFWSILFKFPMYSDWNTSNFSPVFWSNFFKFFIKFQEFWSKLIENTSNFHLYSDRISSNFSIIFQELDNIAIIWSMINIVMNLQFSHDAFCDDCVWWPVSALLTQ